MSDPTSFALDALYLALRLSLPVLGVAFVVALLIGFVQTLTQLREPTLNAIPRLVSVTLVVALSAGAFSDQLVRFTAQLYRSLPELVQTP